MSSTSQDLIWYTNGVTREVGFDHPITHTLMAGRGFSVDTDQTGTLPGGSTSSGPASQPQSLDGLDARLTTLESAPNTAVLDGRVDLLEANAADVSAIDARVGALEAGAADVGAIDTRVGALESAPAATTLDTRLTAIENGPNTTALDTRITTLENGPNTTALDDRITTLENAPSGGAGVLNADGTVAEDGSLNYAALANNHKLASYPHATVVQISPGTDVSAINGDYPDGTDFFYLAGVHDFTGFGVITARPGQTFRGAIDSNGTPLAILDGGGTATRVVQNFSAPDVTIRDLEIQNFAGAQYQGVVHVQTVYSGGANKSEYYGTPLNCLIENLFVHHNAGAGIHYGSGTTIKGCRIMGNQWLGIHGGGQGVHILNNEIAYNCKTGWDQGQGGWHAGGIKVTRTFNSVVRGNYLHHNWGPGVWFDVGCRDNIVTENAIYRNRGVGVYYEISHTGTISHNWVVYNNTEDGIASWVKDAGVLISTADSCVIHDNWIEAYDLGTQSNVSGRQPYTVAVEDSNEDRTIAGGDHDVNDAMRQRGPIPLGSVGTGPAYSADNTWLLDNTIVGGPIRVVTDNGASNVADRLQGLTETFRFQRNTVLDAANGGSTYGFQGATPNAGTLAQFEAAAPGISGNIEVASVTRPAPPGGWTVNVVATETPAADVPASF